MTVGALLATTTSRELAEWMALYKIEYDEERQRELARRAEAKMNARR